MDTLQGRTATTSEYVMICQDYIVSMWSITLPLISLFWCLLSTQYPSLHVTSLRLCLSGFDNLETLLWHVRTRLDFCESTILQHIYSPYESSNNTHILLHLILSSYMYHLHYYAFFPFSLQPACAYHFILHRFIFVLMLWYPFWFICIWPIIWHSVSTPQLCNYIYSVAVQLGFKKDLFPPFLLYTLWNFSISAFYYRIITISCEYAVFYMLQ